jgi:hypothetical protein
MKIDMRRTNTTILMAGGVVCLVVLLAWMWRPQSHDVPENLLGEWRTTDANYADRYFEINQVSISFTTGGGGVSTGWIKEVNAVHEGTGTLYTIVYDLEGVRNELSFYYESGNSTGKTIRFKNQQNTVWTKKESS